MTSTPTTTRPSGHPTSPALSRLRGCSTALALLALVQLGLGIYAASKGDGPIQAAHGGFGYLATLLAIVTAVFARSWSRESGVKGTFYHALSLPILCLVQLGLAGAGLKWVHVVVGILYVLAVAGLFSMLRRR